MPHVIGLTKPSVGGSEYEELIFRIWATSVGSFGIQLPMTIRPPGRVTRTISFETRVACSDEVRGDIDAEDVGPEFRRRQGGRAVAAARIQHLEAFDAERRDERLAALPHARCDSREITFLP
jgi:hypothetical protein